MFWAAVVGWVVVGGRCCIGSGITGATPSPTLSLASRANACRTTRELFQSRCGRWHVLRGRGQIGGVLGNGCEILANIACLKRQPPPEIPPDGSLPCRAKPAAGEGWGGGSVRGFDTNGVVTHAICRHHQCRFGAPRRTLCCSHLHTHGAPGVYVNGSAKNSVRAASNPTPTFSHYARAVPVPHGGRELFGGTAGSGGWMGCGC